MAIWQWSTEWYGFNITFDPKGDKASVWQSCDAEILGDGTVRSSWVGRCSETLNVRRWCGGNHGGNVEAFKLLSQLFCHTWSVAAKNIQPEAKLCSRGLTGSDVNGPAGSAIGLCQLPDLISIHLGLVWCSYVACSVHLDCKCGVVTGVVLVVFSDVHCSVSVSVFNFTAQFPTYHHIKKFGEGSICFAPRGSLFYSRVAELAELAVNQRWNIPFHNFHSISIWFHLPFHFRRWFRDSGIGIAGWLTATS